MKIRTRMCVSLDGYVTTPEGWPVQLADPGWSAEAYGFRDFQDSCDAVLMGRSTFEPALAAESWPWPDLDVFVLGSHRPEGTPNDVVVEADPGRLLGRIRTANRGGDVHLVGGPRTIAAFIRLDALDLLGLIVCPVLVGSGMQLTPSLATEMRLRLESEQRLPGGAVEVVYAIA
jgi:dihydrofolate reductase